VTIKADDALIDLIAASDLFDSTYYSDQVPEAAAWSRVDQIRHYLEEGESSGKSPTIIFDAQFYCRTYPDLQRAPNKFAHFVEYGHAEGRLGTLAAFLIQEDLDEVAIQEHLVPDPEVDRSSPHYLRALARAIKRGESDPQYFSGDFYLRMYPDLRSSSSPPLVHYLLYGREEQRRCNIDLLDDISFNHRAVVRDRPFIMVGAHECSRTGAPKVALDLASELSKHFNIIFVALEEGPLLPLAKYRFPVTVRASKNAEEAKLIYQMLHQICPFDRAIFSSVACEAFMRGLAETDVQIICLVHEFREDFFWVERSIVNFCDLLVFSSRRLLSSWANLILEVGRSTGRSLVLPQPPAADNGRRLSKADARAEVERRTGLALDGAILVLGAGLVQIRKGTDIFLQVATDLRTKPGKYVCVWIGKQIHEEDQGFGVYLHAHIDLSRDEKGRAAVHFLPPGSLYETLMDAADVFVLPSRLDPLPNVALDAAERNTAVIAFKGATGLPDLAEAGRIRLIEVEYGSIEQTVAAIQEETRVPNPLLRLLKTDEGAAEATLRPWEYESYARHILKAADDLRARGFAASDVAIDPEYTGPIMRTRFDAFHGEAERKSSTNLVRKILRLGVATVNPRPGVHSSRDGAGELTRYRSVWSQDRKIEQLPPNALIHVHAYYPDVLEEIFSRFAKRARAARVVLTTSDESRAELIRTMATDFGITGVEIIIGGNAGRDIGPFLDHIPTLSRDEDIVCHIHTKKSPDAGDWFGQKWRNNMFQSMLSQPAVNLIEDREIGLVIPDNPRNNGWGKNWSEAEEVACHWGRALPLHPGPFPIGNMFWVKGVVLRKMREATLGMEWPAEPVPVDGTLLHAIERLWPMACAEAGKTIAAVHARSSRSVKDAAGEESAARNAARRNAMRRRRQMLIDVLAGH
jgi:glycosyltransferase involved in cell wall biosynthesis